MRTPKLLWCILAVPTVVLVTLLTLAQDGHAQAAPKTTAKMDVKKSAAAALTSEQAETRYSPLKQIDTSDAKSITINTK